MDFKKITIDGQDLLRDGASGILIEDGDRRQLRTSSTSRDLSGRHGRIRSREYARVRRIVIEGLLDGLGNNYLELSYQYLSDLLGLYELVRKITVRDLFDNERKIDAVITEPIEFIDYDPSFQGAAYKRRVVLESEKSPLYKSLNEIVVEGIKTVYGGFEIPFEIPFSLGSSSGDISVLSKGNQKTPLKIIIDNIDGGIVGPLTIIETGSSKSFILNTDADDGDVIIINSEDNTVTKNGVNIVADREAGSVRPEALGFAKFVVFDANPDTNSDFRVTVKFNNLLL